MKNSFKQERAPSACTRLRYPWLPGGKAQYNKWFAKACHNSSLFYRSSKWTQGSQQVAVWNNKRRFLGTFHLSEIVLRQGKVISYIYILFWIVHTEKSFKLTEIFIAPIQSQYLNQYQRSDSNSLMKGIIIWVHIYLTGQACGNFEETSNPLWQCGKAKRGFLWPPTCIRWFLGRQEKVIHYHYYHGFVWLDKIESYQFQPSHTG